MKKFTSIVLFLVLLSGCKYYKIREIIKPSVDVHSYGTFYIGWLDFGEDKGELYGFYTKERWLRVIRTANIQQKRQYFHEAFPGKNLLFAKDKNDSPPENCCAIIFENVHFIYKKDIINLTIRFVDTDTSKELSRATVTIDAWRGASWSGYVFENRLYNSVRNITYFIKEKMM